MHLNVHVYQNHSITKNIFLESRYFRTYLFVEDISTRYIFLLRIGHE